MDYFDNKEMTEDFRCIASNFRDLIEFNELKTEGTNLSVVQFMHSNSFSQELYDSMEAIPNAEELPQYMVNDGALLSFEGADLFALMHNLNEQGKPSEKWEEIKQIHSQAHDWPEEQFLRYWEVVETDVDNYLAMYTCFESGQYRDSETGRPISMDELQLKGQMSPLDYQKAIQEDVEEWEMYMEMQGTPLKTKEDTKASEPKKEPAQEVEVEATQSDSSVEVGSEGLEANNEEKKAFEMFDGQELSPDDEGLLEEIEMLLAGNLEATQLTDDML